MAYIKTNWVARVGTALNRFLKTNETSTEVELTADPTGVSVPGTPFTVDNMNKIEQGIYDAHVTADANASNLLANVNQGVKTTDSPSFASVNTGHGANELYPMNQAVRTTDSPTFAKLKLTTSTYGRQSIESEGTWVVPVGIYQMTASRPSIYIQVYTGSEWRGASTGFGGAVISDGANVRIYNSDTSSFNTIYYRKFS